MLSPSETKLNGTCFVIMGFGKKTDFESGRTLDLDMSYTNLIKPAVEATGLTCIRADEIIHTGIIDVPMYEQLLNADVVVADISTSNKNAYYELGVRHALKPFTTIVISEDGAKSFPFDVNHVSIKKYHHLGEDIGYSEVQRFRKLLTTAINEVYGKDPREKDSPVYTFLSRLNPPGLAEAVQAAIEEIAATTINSSASVPETSSSGTTAVYSELMKQVDSAKQDGDFLTAKSLLAVIRKKMRSPDHPEDPYIIQQLALMTYKSKIPTPEKALLEALEILAILNPETSNDTETLGLWGAVNKRLYELNENTDHLSQSVRAYERGFYLRNDYYNGINLAFLLNVRAYDSKVRAEAIADFIQAHRIRKEVIDICDQWLNNPVNKEMKENAGTLYWVLATKAEALIGSGNNEKGQEILQKAYEIAPETWMQSSTQEQLDKLNILLTDSPLKYILAD